MRVGRSLRVGVAVVALLAGSPVMHASGEARSATARTFRVLLPDGRPAVGAFVTARVLRNGSEPERREPYNFRADRAGLVTVDIPLTDPAITSEPNEQMYTVLAVVHDAGIANLAVRPAFVAYLLNLGDRLWPADPSGIEGRTVSLSAAAATDLLADDPPTETPEEAHCFWNGYPYTPAPPAWECNNTLYPDSLRAVPVPVAHNFGAGADFDIAVQYRNSHHTTTSVVVGSDGTFVEQRTAGKFALDGSINVTDFRSGVYGGGGDEQLRMSSAFKEVHDVVCGGSGHADCVETWIVLPDHMNGFFSTAEAPSHHDQMQAIGSVDCGNYMDVGSSFENSAGVSKALSYTAGMDINGQIVFANMHATTTWEHYDETTDSASYRWSVPVGPTYPAHYVFVPGGVTSYVDTEPGGGASCPVNSPGDIYTDASDDSGKSPDAPGFGVHDRPDPVEPVERTVRRCEEAPERCGKE